MRTRRSVFSAEHFAAHSKGYPGDRTEPAGVSGCLTFSVPLHPSSRATQPGSPRSIMLRQILLNSTDAPDFNLVLMAQSSTHDPASLNASHGGSVSVAALLRPTTGRGGGGGLREGELHKPDLVTYIIMCLLLFLLVLLIVFFINCQLRNSFFASMPYDRSLREARTSYK
ncbi:uncharacterized protein smim32 [Genypterus blacodes]|uniref:uncharacterized protein smim32 n=1 Tax=Genypterus blacodes TaxID=154954 RepID=UPI003F772896